MRSRWAALIEIRVRSGSSSFNSSRIDYGHEAPVRCIAGRSARRCSLTIGTVAAQPYPSRPIKLVVPYGPGGAGDVIARIVSEQLAKDLGVSVVVENKPGAGGMIGAQAVASAHPDGYTVLVGNTTEMVVGPYLSKSASYETQRDFRPVALAGYLPQLLVANPSIKATTIDEFIALAKANPDKYSYATAGTGSTAHIAGALLERLTGIKLLSVPYKGGAQAVADVLAGNVSIYFSGIPPAIGNVKAGTLVALGIAGTRPFRRCPMFRCWRPARCSAWTSRRGSASSCPRARRTTSSRC